MNVQLKAVLDQIAAKNKEAQDLLAKTDTTAEDVAAAKTIIENNCRPSKSLSNRCKALIRSMPRSSPHSS